MVTRAPEAVMSILFKDVVQKKAQGGLMLLANLEKLCLQQCCTKRYLLSCQPGPYVCHPGSLSGALVNLEVVIRSVVDEDRLWWQMRNQFLLDPLEEVVPIHLTVVVSSPVLDLAFSFEESRL